MGRVRKILLTMLRVFIQPSMKRKKMKNTALWLLPRIMMTMTIIMTVSTLITRRRRRKRRRRSPLLEQLPLNSLLLSLPKTLVKVPFTTPPYLDLLDLLLMQTYHRLQMTFLLLLMTMAEWIFKVNMNQEREKKEREKKERKRRRTRAIESQKINSLFSNPFFFFLF